MDFLNFIKKNSSIILTVLSSVGLIATSILSVRAGMKLQKEQNKPELEKEKRTRIVKTLLPPVAVGAATLGCIVSNCVIDEKRYKSLLTLYSAATSALATSKPNKPEFIEQEDDEFIPVPNDDEELFYDFYRGYFTSTRDKVLEAECNLNKQFAQEGFVTLNDWYRYLGLKPISGVESVAWYDSSCSFVDSDPTYDGIINFEHELVKLENDENKDGLSAICISINITTPPTVCVDTLY